MPTGDEEEPFKTRYLRFSQFVFGFIDKPATYFREKFVEPIQSKNKNYYYHRRFRRVPTVDECYTDDPVCYFEANEQFKRDKLVDDEVLCILRERRMDCETFYGHDAPVKCKKLADDYTEAETNWFVKYGDIGPIPNVMQAYFKQKHRHLWERRHGPVGSGMKDKPIELDH